MGFFDEAFNNAVGSVTGMVTDPLRVIREQPPALRLATIGLATGGAAYLLAPSSVAGGLFASGASALNTGIVATAGAIGAGDAALGASVGSSMSGSALVTEGAGIVAGVQNAAKTDSTPTPSPVAVAAPQKSVFAEYAPVVLLAGVVVAKALIL